MEVKLNIMAKIHNRHDIFMRNAETGEVIQQGQAENIVLDRIYTRLLAFSSYFDNIVFGSGSGEFSPARTTLFNRVGSKPAITEKLTTGYPTSVWTRKVTLGTGEFNGHRLTEVGISDTTTNINTHAIITDSEGNPLEMEEKTELIIVDIYSTVFIEIYDVDSGLFFFDDGLRDYLTGGSTPNNSIRLRYLSDDDATTLTGTRTSNAGDKSVTVSVKFDVQHFNKDVKYIDWVGLGIRCVIPRPGVFTTHDRIGVPIGVGDGVTTRFPLPNIGIKNASFKVDGIIHSDWSLDVSSNEVVFVIAPGEALPITSDFTCTLIPKDIDHILNVTMTMAFGGGIHTPVVPEPDYSTLPGPKVLTKGDLKLGYYGVTTAAELITGEALLLAMGLSDGVLQHSEAGWLKYAHDNSLKYVAKKAILNSISWNAINANGAVWGDRMVEIDGMLFAVSLLSTQEWDKLIYPVHVDFGEWDQFTDEDLLVHYTHGNGSYSWTSTPSGSGRILRGGYGVANSDNYSPTNSNSHVGFRPVLTFLRAL